MIPPLLTCLLAFLSIIFWFLASILCSLSPTTLNPHGFFLTVPSPEQGASRSILSNFIPKFPLFASFFVIITFVIPNLSKFPPKDFNLLKLISFATIVPSLISSASIVVLLPGAAAISNTFSPLCGFSARTGAIEDRSWM